MYQHVTSELFIPVRQRDGVVIKPWRGSGILGGDRRERHRADVTRSPGTEAGCWCHGQHRGLVMGQTQNIVRTLPLQSHKQSPSAYLPHNTAQCPISSRLMDNSVRQWPTIDNAGQQFVWSSQECVAQVCKECLMRASPSRGQTRVWPGPQQMALATVVVLQFVSLERGQHKHKCKQKVC